MLGRVLAVLLGTLILTTGQAKAESLMMGIALQCDSEAGKIMAMVQDKYGEQPFAQAEGLIQNINGKWQKAFVYTFINPHKGSYSIIISDPVSGIECLMLAGEKFMPIVQGDPT